MPRYGAMLSRSRHRRVWTEERSMAPVAPQRSHQRSLVARPVLTLPLISALAYCLVRHVPPRAHASEVPLLLLHLCRRGSTFCRHLCPVTAIYARLIVSTGES